MLKKMRTVYYFRLNRQTVGVMAGAKRVLDNLTRVSIASSTITALSTSMGGGKIDLLLPIVAGLVGILTTSTRDLLSFIIDATVVLDAIDELPPVVNPTE